MTKAQEKHLRSIKQRFSMLVDSKYRAGAREHGNNLLKMKPLALLLEARDECVDQFVFIQRAIDELCD